ncbi:MAG TPA: aspartyl/asparaginyl beta-hydroxylase domain-containing protein [Crenotrichaceae bacterium]|nr:aspartyl/asparaginyl beta-hydroxylase domain-containing protein [Crenotrichaceae bacterium]
MQANRIKSHEESSLLDRLKKKRRKLIKKTGKKIIRSVANDFMARQSLVGDSPVFDTSQFSWVSVLEDNWQVIRSELDAVLLDKELIPSFHELSPDQTRISKGDNWKTFPLWVFREKSVINCSRCPHTDAVLEKIPGLQNAWFSILAPGYHIPAHRGVTKAVLRVQLGLKIPNDRLNCTMRVDDVTFAWQEGKCVVLDDSFDHEVHNNTKEERVILFLDVDRPMKAPGRIASKVLLFLLQRSAYVVDARKNLKIWEQRYREHLDETSQNNQA